MTNPNSQPPNPEDKEVEGTHHDPRRNIPPKKTHHTLLSSEDDNDQALVQPRKNVRFTKKGFLNPTTTMTKTTATKLRVPLFSHVVKRSELIPTQKTFVKRKTIKNLLESRRSPVVVAKKVPATIPTLRSLKSRKRKLLKKNSVCEFNKLI